jgi:2-amino-4-hydroxy-6-hydroxymethyldihydropteridine diphosphokinase
VAGERIFIGLGSNVGDRLALLKAAVRALKTLPGTRVAGLSPVYETSPVGPRQRNFLNAAAELRTSLSPSELLKGLKALEAGLGRRRRRKWGPREIDLDILYYGRRKARAGTPRLPHPRVRERKFALLPVAALAPRFKDPAANETVAALARRLTAPDQSIRVYRGAL